MEKKEVKIEELSNDDLVKLYQDILVHIKFLNDSIINETQKGGTISSKAMNKRWRRMYEILSGNVK